MEEGNNSNSLGIIDKRIPMEERLNRLDNLVKEYADSVGAEKHTLNIFHSIIMGVAFPKYFEIKIKFKDGSEFGQTDSNFTDCFDKLKRWVFYHNGKGETPSHIYELEWKPYPENKPTEYGEYLVYRAGCNKRHFETWNNTGWAYNNNDITHFSKVKTPFSKEEK